MCYEWPPRRFIWPLPVALLLGWAKDTITTWFNGVTLPAWLPVVLIGMFIGLLINDALNPRSWLRQNWRLWRSLFDVVTVHAGHCQTTPERIELICIIKFRKTIKNALLNVRVITPYPSRDNDIKITHSESIDLVKDSQKNIKLGSVAITNEGDSHACHSVWGEKLGGKDLEQGQHSIIGQSRVIIEVSVNHQTYRIYAHILDPNRKESSSVYLLTQDQFPSLI
jgi:hypothetical protein